MAKKVNPKSLRLGVTRTWPSKWFVSDKKTYIKRIQQDLGVRRHLIKNLREAGVDRVEIERDAANRIIINLFTAKPGLLIGRGGSGIEDLKKTLHEKYLKSFRLKEIQLNVHEVSRPNLSAQIMIQSLIMEIEKRMPFKRVMKQAIARAERAGALGVKIMMGGRLNGAEIARSEMLISGKLPLQTLRADIDYARGAAHTTYGAIGIKVWIYKGEIFDKVENQDRGEVIKTKR